MTETECTSKSEEKCETAYEEQCTTVYEQQCSSVPGQQQCVTVNDQVGTCSSSWCRMQDADADNGVSKKMMMVITCSLWTGDTGWAKMRTL